MLYTCSLYDYTCNNLCRHRKHVNSQKLMNVVTCKCIWGGGGAGGVVAKCHTFAQQNSCYTGALQPSFHLKQHLALHLCHKTSNASGMSKLVMIEVVSPSADYAYWLFTLSLEHSCFGKMAFCFEAASIAYRPLYSLWCQNSHTQTKLTRQSNLTSVHACHTLFPCT